MPLAPLLSTVREHLIGQNLNVQLVGDGEAITVNMDLKHLRVLLAFAVQGKSRLVQIEAFLPVRIPEGRRPAVVDFLSRVNWSIRNGRFVIDLDDGGQHQGGEPRQAGHEETKSQPVADPDRAAFVLELRPPHHDVGGIETITEQGLADPRESLRRPRP